jgi:aspartate/methionine/tyrosine aminotransferase
MSRVAVAPYPTNHDAFAFLAECLRSEYDFTSAEPPHPESSAISPPRKVLELMGAAAMDFAGYSEAKGMSRGEDTTLQECVKFFNRHGIGCSKENVSLSVNILSALEHVYRKRRLSETNKIIVPTPTFGYYFKQFQDNGIGFETLPTRAENHFLIDAEALEKMIVETRAKTLLLCYPNNPTGAVMTEENARAVAEVVKRHDVFVISDEAFISNSLSDKKHFSIAAVEGMLDRSFTVTSAAKSMFIGNIPIPAEEADL